MALQVNGIDQGLTGPSPLDLQPPFSAICKYRLDSNSTQDQALFTIGSTADNSNFHRLGTRTDGRMRYRIAASNGGSSSNSSNFDIVLDTWQTAGLMCATATERYVALDGVVTQGATANRVPANINNISIGYHQTSNVQNFFPGMLAEVAVYDNRILDANDIGDFHEGRSPEFMHAQDLVFYAKLISASTETWSGTVMSTQGAPVYSVLHPRMQYPSQRRYISIPAAGPVLSSVDPTSGLEGTLLTLTGENLSEVTHIRFDDGQ